MRQPLDDFVQRSASVSRWSFSQERVNFMARLFRPVGCQRLDEAEAFAYKHHVRRIAALAFEVFPVAVRHSGSVPKPSPSSRAKSSSISSKRRKVTSSVSMTAAGRPLP